MPAAQIEREDNVRNYSRAGRGRFAADWRENEQIGIDKSGWTGCRPGKELLSKALQGRRRYAGQAGASPGRCLSTAREEVPPRCIPEGRHKTLEDCEWGDAGAVGSVIMDLVGSACGGMYVRMACVCR
jgi:hypothetical protein